MGETEFVEAFKSLLRSLDSIPGNLTELRRLVSCAITEEKNRRIMEYEMSVTRCIMEEDDYNKLAAIKQINAIEWKKAILSGKIKKSVENIRPYICPRCWKQYDIEQINAKRKQDELDNIRRREENKKNIEISKQNRVIEFINTKGQSGYATPSQAFYQFQSAMKQEWIELFSTMNYKDFLNTSYWFVVRGYVLWKSDYKCNLCSKKSGLHVHHRHYKNRGREIFTWKEDLIVLCSHCHAKQHDKLAQNAEH